MHELSIMRNIVGIVAEEAGNSRVTRVKLAIGELSAVMPEALRFSFEAIREGTVLSSARLEIDRVQGQARCLDCGTRYAMSACGGRCRCGSMRYQLLCGDELKIVEIDLD